MEFDLNIVPVHQDFFDNRSKYKNLIFFGAGYLLTVMLEVFKKNNVELPVAICDNDPKKYGTFVEGIEILSLESAKEKYSDLYVLLTNSQYANEIIEQLKTEFCKDKIIYFHPDDFINFKGYREFLVQKKSNLDEIYSKLNDEKSKQVYFDILTARSTGDYNLYKDNFTLPQYFPCDIISINQDEIFLDVGAFTGDTIKELHALTNGNYKKIIACEPNKQSYYFIEEMIKTNDKIELIKKGIGDKNELLKFSVNTQSQSIAGITNDGEITIEVDSLDNLIDQPITFLKMDIEGFEMNALKGAVETIEKYKPTLAICLYHKYTDFVDIPEFILNLNLGYKLYVRHHSLNFSETVMYAIQ